MGQGAEPPPGLDDRTARDCRWYLDHNLLPEQVRALPLGMYRWLNPMKSCIRAIENGG